MIDFGKIFIGLNRTDKVMRHVREPSEQEFDARQFYDADFVMATQEKASPSS